MAKDENNGASSNNGSGPGGSNPSAERVGEVSPDGVWLHGFIDEEDRRFVEAQHARFDELGEELEAEGIDGTEEYEKLLARAATWSSAPS